MQPTLEAVANFAKRKNGQHSIRATFHAKSHGAWGPGPASTSTFRFDAHVKLREVGVKLA
jgi:hypothetical protein